MPDGGRDFAAVRPHLRRRLTAIFGHRVADDCCPFVSSLYRHPTIAEFSGALEFLKRQFTFVTLDETVGYFRDGRALPDYPLFLSFDDGLRGMVDRVAPILRAAGVPAAFFVTADAVDNGYLFYGLRRSYLIECLRAPAHGDAAMSALREALRRASVHTAEGRGLIDHAAGALAVDWRSILAESRPYMTRAECRSLLDMGFALGAHGRSHDRFAELDAAARVRELTQSIDFMETAFGLSRVAFAFPHSHRGVGRDWMVGRLAADPRLSIFFGTKGFAPSDSVLVHRVGFDRPPEADGPFDIAALIAHAWRRAG
jgi:peptidoglycan/xylan/chitin deacetylase (PgdA/CDA1 family)